MRRGRYAAIDIGTVTCRLLVADVDARGLYELDRAYAITNLGEGVDGSGMLRPAAIQRVIDAVEGFKGVIAARETPGEPLVRTVALATSAARDAKNSDMLVERLSARGVGLSVISGEREAELSFSGASCDFPGENLIIVDVGGGSTEVAAGRAGEAPTHFHSFNVGCRRVTEKFFSCDPPSGDDLSRARAWVRAETAPFFQAARLADPGPDRLVAVAGTATTVVSVRDGMAVYDERRVHRSVVDDDDLGAVYRLLAGMTLDERRAVVGLEPGRAPVIVAGLLILQNVLDLAGVDSFTVSETDILHGAIMSAASADGVIVPTDHDVPFALHMRKKLP